MIHNEAERGGAEHQRHGEGQHVREADGPTGLPYQRQKKGARLISMPACHSASAAALCSPTGGWRPGATEQTGGT